MLSATDIRSSLLGIAVISMAMKIILAISAAVLGWQLNLNDPIIGFPCLGDYRIQWFSCAAQIEHRTKWLTGHTHVLPFDPIFPVFLKEMLLSMFAMIFSTIGAYLMVRIFHRASDKATEDIPLPFLLFLILFSVLIFAVDGLRYAITSVFAVEKYWFTWSSFCIAGPFITAIDKLGSLFEAVPLALPFALAACFLQKKLAPTLNFDHLDGECGQKKNT